MNRFVVHLALLVALGGSFTLAVPAQPPGGAAEHHARMEGAFKQLDLTPRQKIEIVKIMRNAKACGQDKETTLQQVSAVLTPEQKRKLIEQMKESRGK